MTVQKSKLASCRLSFDVEYAEELIDGWLSSGGGGNLRKLCATDLSSDRSETIRMALALQALAREGRLILWSSGPPQKFLVDVRLWKATQRHEELSSSSLENR